MKALFPLLLLAAGGYSRFHSTAEPAPRPHRFSEDHVFYLRQYVPVRTANGIVGWVPGQQVRQCAACIPGKIMVTDGWEAMALNEDLLTQDMDEAAALKASDSQIQRELLAQVDQAEHIAAARQQALDIFTGDAINRQNAYQMQVNAVGNFHSVLDSPPVESGSDGGPVFGWYAADAPQYAGYEAAASPQTGSATSTDAPVASQVASLLPGGASPEVDELLSALQKSRISAGREEASARALAALRRLDGNGHTTNPVGGYVRSIAGLKEQVETTD